MLLEALISILIFSIGILGIVSLQALSIKNSGDAKYRSDASLLANQLIAQMWVSDRTPAVVQAKFASLSSGAAYTAWLNDVAAALPGASATPPNVAINTVTATIAPSSFVTITIYWNAPSEAPKAHKYTVVAQIT